MPDDTKITWDTRSDARRYRVYIGTNQVYETKDYSNKKQPKTLSYVVGSGSFFPSESFRVEALYRQIYSYRIRAYLGDVKSGAANDRGFLHFGKGPDIAGEGNGSGVQASDGTFTSQVLIEWEDDVDAEDGFKVERGGTLIADLPPDVVSLSDIDANPGEIHNYRVFWTKPGKTEVVDSEEDKRSTEALDDGQFLHKIVFKWKSGPDKTGSYRVYRGDELQTEIASTETKSWEFTFPYSEKDKYIPDPDKHPFEGLYPNFGLRVEAVIPPVDKFIGKDFGRRKPNGNIAGRIQTVQGAGVEHVKVCLNPLVSRALFFDGQGGYVDFDRVPVASTFTLSFWLNLSNGGKDQTILASGRRTGAPDPNFRVYVNADNELTVSIKGTEHSEGVLKPGVWHYVTVVKEETLVTAYNGVEPLWAKPIVFSDSFDDPGNILTFGMSRRFEEPVNFLNGRLDEIRIWDDVRDVDQIEEDLTRVLDPDEEEGLTDYWPIDGSHLKVVANVVRGEVYGEMSNGVYRTEDVAPFDVCALTDAEGNYNIPNIRYGTEQLFEIRPQTETADGRIL
ncbi:MAG: LamG domain-containing protein, partial [Candidatus Latescibacteria bacterium]|nr:LamG domain-containing protein [Candidatus Latescibacterota bacterium]